MPSRTLRSPCHVANRIRESRPPVIEQTNPGTGGPADLVRIMLDGPSKVCTYYHYQQRKLNHLTQEFLMIQSPAIGLTMHGPLPTPCDRA